VYTPRRARLGDESIGTFNGTAVVPIAGGTVLVTVTAAQLGFSNKIEGLIIVTINSNVPTTQNISTPVFGLSGTSLVVGVTLGGATGTTLGYTIAAWGY